MEHKGVHPRLVLQFSNIVVQWNSCVFSRTRHHLPDTWHLLHFAWTGVPWFDEALDKVEIPFLFRCDLRHSVLCQVPITHLALGCLRITSSPFTKMIFSTLRGSTAGPPLTHLEYASNAAVDERSARKHINDELIDKSNSGVHKDTEVTHSYSQRYNTFSVYRLFCCCF